MVISRLDWTARLEPECAEFADCATEVRPAPARSDVARDPLIGRSIGGRYRVLARIGQGNAGAVYLAERIGLRRRVAIKLMLPRLTAAAEAIARFRREARVSSLARSEHIVEVMELGRLPEGALFLVMEYLGTRDVARLVAAEGALCVPRAAEIGLQICSALDAVHRAGVVHRDLKPEHVFLIERSNTCDFVKVVDFGICKVTSSGSLTGAGIALGTPRFMAPEQLEARPDVDARVDLYALGGILFFMLTAKCPFEASSLPELLVRVWSEPAPRLCKLRADAPKSLDALIDRALQKDRNKRPTLKEFREVLEQFAPTRSAQA